MSVKRRLSYRLDRLPVIMPYHRRSDNNIQRGDLVYYGPSPEYYGIGEVIETEESYCLVDFRGTGLLGIQKDVFANRYIIPIHGLNLGNLLKSV